MRYLLFYKPYGVLTQFTDRTIPPRPTLADYISVPHVYAAGRLDADSEGLLLLTDDGRLKHRLLQPEFAHRRTYWVQVEGVPDASALERLSAGVIIQGDRTRPADANVLDEPDLPPRCPPIRSRAAIPTSWISLTLTEGRNRQVRRMTAAVGYPTLRLVRWSMENLTIAGLQPGQWRDLTASELRSLRRICG
ncbi:MAG TPA: pseudouridine synthase [Bryobacteraceae bacterium]|nr:pseudouridine synthase [Bryobacteraceae bacterium]